MWRYRRGLHDTPDDREHWHHAAAVGCELQSDRVGVYSVGWLGAGETSLIEAMEALHALAAQQVAEQAQLERMWTEDIAMVAAEAFEVVDNKKRARARGSSALVDGGNVSDGERGNISYL